MAAQKFVLPFSKIDKNDTLIVGGKGANLGEMFESGFPVPDGFVVTVNAYDIFFKDNNLDKAIYGVLGNTDVNDSSQLDQTSRHIRKLVNSSKVPDELSGQVFSSYKKLSGVFKKALVAVRSSATAEDMPNASFAGQQATYLNIKGEANLVEAVRNCWSSLFTSRSIFYRVQNKITHKKVKVAVVVQKMIQSEVSGVMFTVDPVTHEKDKIIIESVWGLGEMIVQGSVIPDRYVVQKETNALLSKEISEQRRQLIKIGSETKEMEVPKGKLSVQKISDEEVKKLAKIGEKLQAHYYFPQDIEWAKEKGKLYIVQTRPITTLNKKRRTLEPSSLGGSEKTEISGSPILKGSGASPGIATGYVKIVKSPKEIAKVKEGDVLVAPMTSPDFVPAMKKAAGIVTDQGGQTSHAAIVSRELGIPCIVGTLEATKKLKEGEVVSVDGSSGVVYLGSKIQVFQKTGDESSDRKEEKIIRTKTATKLYVNLAESERVRDISKLNVDGVGLLRAEFMIANIGVHPKEAIKEKKQEIFIKELAHGMETFCKAFNPRPVVYRATDFKTNEYRSLKGGNRWEPEEPNPMLGFRGAFRYLANPDVFTLELEAIKRVRQKYNNLWIMIPFVRSPAELLRIKRMVAAHGLFESTSFKFWMMVELPVNVILFEEFIKVGIDGISIGSNDLTMLILGTDRDNSEVSQAFDERSPAVLWALKRVINSCNNHGITSSICGQAPSSYEDLVELLVKLGITSVSVNPDAINRTRGILIRAEEKLSKK